MLIRWLVRGVGTGALPLQNRGFSENETALPATPTKETGFLTKSAGCDRIFRKKPGFSPPHPDQRNRVFDQICGLRSNISQKTRFLGFQTLPTIN